jgi:hypothetical protein
MNSELETLPITEEELENLVELNFVDNLAISIYRSVVIKNYQQTISVLTTEAFIFLVLLILTMPLTLLTIKSLGYLPESSTGVNQLLLTLVAILMVAMVAVNIYLFLRSKKLQSLARLMEEIEKYNRVVKTINLMASIESVSQESEESVVSLEENSSEAIAALKITRTSLINALRVEEIIRKHQDFLNRRYELLRNLENNLANLMEFEVSNQTNEYGRLLNDALKIGMSVHKEVKKLAVTD